MAKTASGRLPEEDVKRILADRKSGKTYQQLAYDYNVSIGTIANLCKGRTWKWLQPSY